MGVLRSYHITGTLTRLISFICHSYENCRVCTNNSHSGTGSLWSPTAILYRSVLISKFSGGVTPSRCSTK